MEQKQPIVHSGRLFFSLPFFSFFILELRGAKLLLCSASSWLWRTQAVADDDRVELKFPCHFQIADVSKLNLARFSVLYYEVCLAFSQILMKSSMHETIPMLCLLNSIAFSLCVFSDVWILLLHFTALHVHVYAHCLNIHGSRWDCKTSNSDNGDAEIKIQSKIMDSLDYHYFFSI